MSVLTWENVRSDAARGANPERHLTRSLDLGERQAAVKATRVCSIDDCDREIKARQWCNPHYLKWAKYGDPLAVGRSRHHCTVDGCPGLVKGNGYCSRHWQTWRKYGSPTAVGTLGRPRAANVGYLAAHKRVYRARGAATRHLCRHCGAPAVEWAYDHTDPNERVGATRGTSAVRYSTDPMFYMPLCRVCHKRFDDAARPKRGEANASGE